MQKEHTKSLDKCFMNICWKRGLQNQQRNCSSFKKVLERESILSLPCLFSPLTMYNKTIIGFGFCEMGNYQRLGKGYLLPRRSSFRISIPNLFAKIQNIVAQKANLDICCQLNSELIDQQ